MREWAVRVGGLLAVAAVLAVIVLGDRALDSHVERHGVGVRRLNIAALKDAASSGDTFGVFGLAGIRRNRTSDASPARALTSALEPAAVAPFPAGSTTVEWPPFEPPRASGFREPLLDCDGAPCGGLESGLAAVIGRSLAPWPIVASDGQIVAGGDAKPEHALTAAVMQEAIDTYLEAEPFSTAVVVLVDSEGIVWLTRRPGPDATLGKALFGPSAIDPATARMLRMLQRSLQGAKTPPVEFILSSHDHPGGLLSKSGVPLPLFSICTNAGGVLQPGGAASDIPVPNGEFSAIGPGQVYGQADWPAALAPVVAAGDGYDAMLHMAPNLESQFPWAQRTPVAFWRGGTWCVHPHRLVRCSRSHLHRLTHEAKMRRERGVAPGPFDGLLDASFTGTPYDNAVDPANTDSVGALMPTVPFVSLFNHTAFRFLIQLDGLSYSHRFMKLLALGSLVLKQRSDRAEFFYPALRPGDHYVEIFGDSPNDVFSAVRWATQNDGEAQRIAQNGQAWVRSHLCFKARACYWRTLLEAYAKQLAYAPAKRPGFSYHRLDDVLADLSVLRY